MASGTADRSAQGSLPPQGGAVVEQAGERRLARIESMRALAAIGVVIGHSWGAAHHYGPSSNDDVIARMIFGSSFGAFMLLGMSGYLLYWPFVRHHFGVGSPIALRQYALNRALRILPLYYVAIVFLLLVSEDGGSLKQWVAFLTFGANFFKDTVATVDGPLWSVIIELHFYLVLPPLAAGLAWASRGRLGRAVVLLSLLCAASLALWLWQVTFQERGQINPLWRYSLPATFYFIGIGMLLALARLAIERRRPAWMQGALGSADLWVVASIPLWIACFQEPRLLPLITIACFLVVGATILPLRAGRLLGALDWRPLAAIGIASYSLYVWHNPLIEAVVWSDWFPDRAWVVMPIIPPLCVAVALVSYRWIEEPFLRLRRRWSPAAAASRPAGGPT
jgi:peptidoglycan/LPS O-acetylase OafA/YrhL